MPTEEKIPTVIIANDNTIVADEERKAYEKRKLEHSKKPEVTTKLLYWFGMMPAKDAADHWFTQDQFETTELGEKVPKTPRWMARCKFFNSLNIAGVEFNAYSIGMVQDERGNRTATGDFKPGEYRHFTADEIKLIKEQAYRRFIRPLADGSRGFYLYEQNVGFVPSPQDIPAAKFVYMVPIQEKHEIPPLDYFFEHPPKSLAGD